MGVVNADVGKRIREERKAQNLTLDELASKIGITAAALSRYELGQRNMSTDTIKAVADALGLSLTALLPGGGDAIDVYNESVAYIDDEIKREYDYLKELSEYTMLLDETSKKALLAFAQFLTTNPDNLKKESAVQLEGNHINIFDLNL